MAAEARKLAVDRFTIRLVDWPEGNVALRAVRQAVFIVEQ